MNLAVGTDFFFEKKISLSTSREGMGVLRSVVAISITKEYPKSVDIEVWQDNLSSGSRVLSLGRVSKRKLEKELNWWLKPRGEIFK